MIFDIIKSLRPKQWIKNLFVFAPLLFGFKYDDISLIINSTIAFVSFVILSGIIYIFNDILDIEKDKKHPKKKFRPIASGKISIKAAYKIIIVLFITLGLIIPILSIECFYIAIAYVFLNIAYSIKLKNYAIIDVIIIASGFILRLLMGGYSTDISLSPWIIMTTFLLSLFLGFGKRYNELEEISDTSRSSLNLYSKKLLDKLICISCSATLISYALYAIEISRESGKMELTYTVLFVVFGLFRYLQSIYIFKKGEEPESIIYNDPIFIINLVAWLFTTLWILSQ